MRLNTFTYNLNINAENCRRVLRYCLNNIVKGIYTINIASMCLLRINQKREHVFSLRK